MPVAFVPYTAAPTHVGAFRGSGLPTANGQKGVPFLDDFTPGYTFGARIYPGADTSKDPATWTPYDVSAHILQPGDGSLPAISITRARMGEQQETAPAQCTLTLRNDPAKGNGDYSPRRATGRYWPYMAAGLPIDVFIATSTSTFVRFAGKVEDLSPAWDETGAYAVVVVTAFGVWQPIQNGATPLRSALYRGLSGSAHLVDYWPCEEPAGAVQAGSDVAGGHPGTVTAGTVTSGQMTLTGVATFGTGGGLSLSNGGQMSFRPRAFTPTNGFTIALTVAIGDVDQTQHTECWPIIVSMSSGWKMAIRFVPDLNVANTGTIDLLMYASSTDSLSAGLAGLSPISLLPGTVHTLVLSFGTVGGQVCWGSILDGANEWQAILGTDLSNSGLTSVSLGRPTEIHTLPTTAELSSIGTSLVFPLDTNYTVSHVAVFDKVAPQEDWLGLGQAYTGDSPSDRFTRICGEEGIPAALPAGPSDPARSMGPQPVDTLYNILRECETVEGGVLEDGVNFGLALWTVESRYNQTTAAFTPALTQLQPPFLPVENTQRIRNDVTASQPSGNSARYQQPAGRPYAVTGPGGIGSRPFPLIVNVEDPGQLINRAAWAVMLGTINADRYGALAVNLAARTALIASWLAVTNGDRWTTSATYPTGGVGPDVLVEGWAEGLSRKVYAIAANSSPALPWNVTVVDDATYGVVDSDSSTLAALVAAGATGAVSVNVGSALWSVAAGDYPLDFNIAGERVTGTMSGGTTPQTLTISARAVNGVSKDLPANSVVSLWLPVVVGV